MRLSPLLLIVLVAACVIPPDNPPTVGPTATPPPTATPIPLSTVTFAAHLPANTPPGVTPAVKIIDDVGGDSQILILANAGENLWTASLPATRGDVLRYKYLRIAPASAEEVTPDRQAVVYRLLIVAGNNTIVEDTVAAWKDTPFAGDTGNLRGMVVSRKTGRGAMGVLVSAGGRLALTAWDGSFEIQGLPTGQQRLTALALDGSLSPAQTAAAVIKNQTIVINPLESEAPNPVRVTFVVRPPASSIDPAATVRLAGNLWQLGDTFFPDVNGSAIAAAQEVALAPLNDGRWAVTVQMYAGAVVHYKYTLGDGVWNSELSIATGRKRLRQLLVPAGDISIEDTIETWHTGASGSVTFEVTLPANTPPNDIAVIQFRRGTWQAPLPMWRASASTWKYVLYNPEDISGNLFYRYCRNYACGSADDADTAGPGAEGSYFALTLLPQYFIDGVRAWRWLADANPRPVLVLPITPTVGFAAGIDLTDEWPPRATALTFYPDTLNAIRTTGANWLTFTRRGAVSQIQPNPVYAEDLTLAPRAADWNTEVALAHAAGIKVALHPVTCHYSPYGACDYWNGVAFTADFWNRWFAAYEAYIINEAELAAQAGADLFVAGDFKLRPSFPGEPEAPLDAEARWRALLANVRKHYSGPLAFELLMGQSVWPSPPPFLDTVDVIRVFWWSTLSTGSAPAVNDLTAVAGDLMDRQLAPMQQKFRKPVQISAAYYSADGAATQCLRRTDSQCYPFESFNPDSVDQSPYLADWQEQADIYQALLTAVSRRAWISGFSAYGYNPVVTLLDKSISVRGKPASAVLAGWYPKLEGK